MAHDVFISYSSKNIDTAIAICHVLENNNIRCWMAPRNIPAGSDYGDIIDVAISECKIFLLLFSEPAAISPWVKGELNLAFTEEKHIIPYRVDHTPLKGAMRLMLNQRHWIDAHPDAADEFKSLVDNMLPILGLEPTAKKPIVQKPKVETTTPVAKKPENPVLPTNLPPKEFAKKDYREMGSPAELIIPSNCTSIEKLGSSLFPNTTLTSITIPNSVTTIGLEAFAYCTSLTAITIPNSVKFIPVFAFKECESLTAITFPNSITTIGGGAFNDCKKLKIINIPRGATHLAELIRKNLSPNQLENIKIVEI